MCGNNRAVCASRTIYVSIADIEYVVFRERSGSASASLNDSGGFNRSVLGKVQLVIT